MTTNILLTPARIGAVEIPNRIVMPPMTTRTADAEGFVTDDSVAYYLARARAAPGSSPSRWPRRREPVATVATRSVSTTTVSCPG